MNKFTGIFLSLYLFTLLLLFQCSSSQLSGIEVTNGNCFGKIYNDDNTPACGALVCLIPSGFDPTDSMSGKIDSTYTRDDGIYAFSVVNSGSYSVIAEKQNKFCKQDSINVLSKVKQSFRDDTLAEPGYLSGCINVKPGSDVTKAIILFIGTNLYISPSNSTGTFGTVSLPEGRYTLKAFTTEEGYGTFDTSFVISSEEKLSIEITLPLSYASEIKNISAKYDSSTFYSTVNWSPEDVSQCMAYSLHRFVNNIEDTVILVDNNKYQYKDNCGNFFADTVFYKICAVGKNYKEGYPKNSNSVIITTNEEIKHRIVFDTVTEKKCVFSIIPIAQDFLCTFTNSSTFRINVDGTVIDSINKQQFSDIFRYPIPDVEADSFNNVYAIYGYDVIRGKGMIYKLNSDLMLLDSLVLDDTSQNRATIGSDGSVYVESDRYYQDLNVFTEIEVFDPFLNHKHDFTINNEISIRKCINDRIFAIEYKFASLNGNNTTLTNVNTYDTSFNLLSSISTAGVCIDIISDNLFVTYTAKDSINTFSLMDVHGNRLTDIKLPSDIYYKSTISGIMFFSKGNKLFAFATDRLTVN